MSLLLHEDHRAWQQRINKEIFSASRANEFFSHYSTTNSFKPRSSSQLKRSQKKSQKLSKRSKKDQASTFDKDKARFTMSFGMYAEVRGKYARPAPQLNKGIANPILKRPHTAFSLRPKSAVGERIEKKEEFSPFLEYLEKSFKVEQRNDIIKTSNSKDSIIRKRRASEQNYNEKKINGNLEENIVNIEKKIGTFEENVVKFEENIGNTEEKIGNIEEKIGNIEGKLESPEISNEKVQTSVEHKLIKDQDPLGNPKNNQKIQISEAEVKKTITEPPALKKNIKNLGIKITSRSSSARTKYIEELERNLREEKLKRMKLEELLNKLN